MLYMTKYGKRLNNFKGFFIVSGRLNYAFLKKNHGFVIIWKMKISLFIKQKYRNLKYQIENF